MSVLDLEHIVLLKMKAWLDLSERKEKGESIDSKSIKKHKNDILRLITSFEKDDPVELKNLDIRNISYEELLDIIVSCYGI